MGQNFTTMKTLFYSLLLGLIVPVLLGCGITRGFQDKPTLTTSLDDAVFDLPIMDEFEPVDYYDLSDLPVESDGVILLDRPGAFEYTAESFCLHAGKYAPGSGDGYLYAPLEGPFAEIVGNIIHRSALHTEVAQRDIQFLVWAVLARTPVNDLSFSMQQVASKLMTPSEIAKLNSGELLGFLGEELADRALDKAPADLRDVLEAEARIRDLATSASTTYEQLESVAVMAGMAPFREGDREVPAGRWSYFPEEAYYVRYSPSGYSKTRVQVYVPEKVEIVRDQLGRIVSLEDESGNHLETVYDETVPPVAAEGHPYVKAYAFKSIRYRQTDPLTGEVREFVQTEKGWTFLDLFPPDIAFHGGGASVAAPPSLWKLFGDRFDGIWDRTQKLDGYHDKYVDHKRTLKKFNRDPSWEDIEDLADLEHYQDGLEAARKLDFEGQAEWINKHALITWKAWNYANWRLQGGEDDEAKRPNKPRRKWKGRELPRFDPSGSSAVPGRSGNQRLGLSLRKFRK